MAGLPSSFFYMPDAFAAACDAVSVVMSRASAPVLKWPLPVSHTSNQDGLRLEECIKSVQTPRGGGRLERQSGFGFSLTHII